MEYFDEKTPLTELFFIAMKEPELVEIIVKFWKEELNRGPIPREELFEIMQNWVIEGNEVES